MSSNPVTSATTSAEVQELRDGRAALVTAGAGSSRVAVTSRCGTQSSTWLTVEASFLVLDDVEEGAAVELHVGEVLEEDVDRLDVGTLELLASQRGSMHSREVVDLLADDDAEVLEAPSGRNAGERAG